MLDVPARAQGAARGEVQGHTSASSTRPDPRTRRGHGGVHRGVQGGGEEAGAEFRRSRIAAWRRAKPGKPARCGVQWIGRQAQGSPGEHDPRTDRTIGSRRTTPRSCACKQGPPRPDGHARSAGLSRCRRTSPASIRTLGLGFWEPRTPGCQEETILADDQPKLARRAYSISCSVLDDDGRLLDRTARRLAGVLRRAGARLGQGEAAGPDAAAVHAAARATASSWARRSPATTRSTRCSPTTPWCSWRPAPARRRTITCSGSCCAAATRAASCRPAASATARDLATCRLTTS